MGSCPGGCGGASIERWTFWSLVGAFVDLALAYTFLCFAAFASAASSLFSFFGLGLPCSCGRPNLGCFHSFLAGYPSRTLSSLLLALRSRWPFVPFHQRGQDDIDDDRRAEPAAPLDVTAALEEERAARAALQRELEKERSAAASAAEEAMAMILRLQKEKSALEIEARQHRRTADERSAYYEEEVEELREIVLRRDREVHALRKELEAYQDHLGIGAPDDDDDDDDDDDGGDEFAPPAMERKASSSVVSVGKNGDSDAAVQLASDRGCSFQTRRLSQDLGAPLSNHAKETFGIAESKSEAEFSEDDGTETVEILPLSVQNRTLHQSRGQDDSAAVKVATKELPSDGLQEDNYQDIEKKDQISVGIENDAHVYDVHVVYDNNCLSDDPNAIVTDLTSPNLDIQRTFLDGTKQRTSIDRLQHKISVDDLGRNSMLNVSNERFKNGNEVDLTSLKTIQGGCKMLRFPASQREGSLQLQLLEEIANQLKEIKSATKQDNT